MAATGPHVSIIAEPVFSVGEFVVTNSLLTSMIISGGLILFALIARASLKQTDEPTGLQNFVELVIESLYNFIHSVTNSHKKTKQFFPIVATFFLYIVLNNWFGLLPGVGTIVVHHEAEGSKVAFTKTEVKVDAVADAYAATEEVAAEDAAHTDGAAQTGDDTHEAAAEGEHADEKHSVAVPIFRPASADLNSTLAFALISVLMTQYFGIAHLGLSYFKKFINFTNPIMFFVGILEAISEMAKIISFAFRLFGNIFAGEVLLTVIAFLIPVVVPIPFYGLEVFVGFIQALVFAMLSLVFFNMATHSHDEH